MPDIGFLSLSAIGVVLGTMLVLYPNGVLRVSSLLNHTLAVLDQQLMRRRYLIAVLAYAAGYACFKIALLLPSLRT